MVLETSFIGIHISASDTTHKLKILVQVSKLIEYQWLVTGDDLEDLERLEHVLGMLQWSMLSSGCVKPKNRELSRGGEQVYRKYENGGSHF